MSESSAPRPLEMAPLEMTPPCAGMTGVRSPGKEIMVIVGEASGDVYGADIVQKMLELNPDIRFFGMGGDRMAARGVDISSHIKEVSVMGFVEVLSRLRPLYRTFRELVELARERQPAAVVFIDFPDFNLRLAPKIKEVCDAKTIYYIGPTVWAWRRGRVQQIAKCMDKMVVIFPFEEPIYREAGVDVEFVGHPLVGTVKTHTTGAREFREEHGLAGNGRLVGLLPGSRAKEVVGILPVLLAAADRLARTSRDATPLRFGISVAESIERADVEAIVARHRATAVDPAPVTIIERATPDLMKHSDLLLVACGTAPLEAAILDTPQVVVYKTARLTYGIASALVTVPHVCMVNLILERRAVPELIQHDFTAERVAEQAMRLLDDADARKQQQDAFAELRRRLGASGASKRAAKSVLAAAGLLDSGASSA